MSTEGEGMGIVCLGRGSLIWNPGVLLAPCAVALALAGPAHAQAGCADWNTGDYFEAATVADVERCLAAGADIEARNEGGMTPLHWAAVFGTAETVTALLAAGADPRARDESGEIPFDKAEPNERLKGTDAWWRLNDARFD